MKADEVFVVHHEPVWRQRANFIVNAEIPTKDVSDRWEQLFARRVGDDRFEICCIPFFVYDIALGDIVDTSRKGDREYVVQRVVEASGRYVFRVWFGESFQPRGEFVDALRNLGSLIEWSSRNLLAVDAIDQDHAKLVAGFLTAQERLDHVTYDTGRSS